MQKNNQSIGLINETFFGNKEYSLNESNLVTSKKEGNNTRQSDVSREFLE
jgi:hypothetical protein